MVKKEKWLKLKAWMARLKLDEEDIEEKFITGSGKGGQKLHKTASCVYLKHRPSGLEVKCQESRSQEDNRYLARVSLCHKMDEKVNKEKSLKRMAIEKLRRQKKKRSKRAKEKILKDKHHQSLKKQQRENVDPDS